MNLNGISAFFNCTIFYHFLYRNVALVHHFQRILQVVYLLFIKIMSSEKEAVKIKPENCLVFIGLNQIC